MRDESCKSAVSGVDSRELDSEEVDGGYLVRFCVQALANRFGCPSRLLASLVLVGLMSTNIADRVQEKE